MKLNTLIISTSVAIAFAIPAVCSAESSVYAPPKQSVLASYVAEQNTFFAVVLTGDSKVAANTPQAIAPGYQHDLSNRSRVSLELSSVDPDIAGLDVSIEGGVMFRHDW